MPGAKDITGDIGKLSKRQLLPKGKPPVLPTATRLERRPAFNGSSFFAWTVIGMFLLMQGAFIVWLVL